MRLLGVCLAGALVAVTVGWSCQPAAATGGVCGQLTIPVAPAPLLPPTEHITGELCVPLPFAGPDRQLDILVHGGSYSRDYWDLGIQSPQYSHVHRALHAGRATFAYDRLGVTPICRPLSTLVNIAADAYVLHQIVQLFRDVHQITDVNVVGHSFGSVVGIHEAATYHDVDRLVVTGLLHASGPAQAELPTSIQPAFLDPQFASAGCDPGYITSKPGVRGAAFYYGPTSEPAVIAFDEAHKAVASATQLADGLAQLQAPAGPNLSNQVDAPVLAVAGQFDRLFCGDALNCGDAAQVHANEVPYYTTAPSFTSNVVADTGHSLALHTTTDNSFTVINQWIRAH